jgi:multidrug efflux pump subunit AcrB
MAVELAQGEPFAAPVGAIYALEVLLRLSDGLSIEEAVLDAGVTRLRPMVLTAAAVIVGTSVILFDPIFQGLAIALMAGEVASTVISRLAVPVLYFMMRQREAQR